MAEFGFVSNYTFAEKINKQNDILTSMLGVQKETIAAASNIQAALSKVDEAQGTLDALNDANERAKTNTDILNGIPIFDTDGNAYLLGIENGLLYYEPVDVTALKEESTSSDGSTIS